MFFQNDQSCCNSFVWMLRVYIFTPIWLMMLQPCYEMIMVLFRKRRGRLQFLIILIISTYALFWFAVEEMLMQYNYLIEAFPGFDGEDMSWFSTANYLCSKLNSWVIVGICTVVVKLHISFDPYSSSNKHSLLSL